MNSTQDVMSISLDDYISERKGDFEMGHYPLPSKQHINESKFKAERRPFKREEIAEDDDEEIWDDTDNTEPRDNEKSVSGIRPAPIYWEVNQFEAKEKKVPFDVREQIINIHSTSPNKEVNDSYSQRRNDGNGKRRKSRFSGPMIQNPPVQKQEQQTFQTIENNLQNSRNIRKIMSGPYERNSFGNYNNNNRLNQQYNLPGHNVNNKQIKNGLGNKNSASYRPTVPQRTLTTDCNSNTITKFRQPGQANEATEAQTPQYLKTILGATDSNLTAATRQQQTIKHEPIYDMNIQKMIHQIQGKPLSNMCSAGKIVSSDGAGIEECQTKDVLGSINSASYRPTLLQRSITVNCNSNSTTKLRKPGPANEDTDAQTPQYVKTILGVTDSNLTASTLPALGTNYLDFQQVGQQKTVKHEPIYDMNIQKMIHEIQGKPLSIMCSAGKIVSSDGDGIEECQIKPNATGISINCRFS